MKEREGLSLTVQVRIAVREWLEKKGVLDKAPRKRAPARKRG